MAHIFEMPSKTCFWNQSEKNMSYKDNFLSICWWKQNFIKKFSFWIKYFVALCNSILNPRRWIINVLDKYKYTAVLLLCEHLLANLSFVFWYVAVHVFFMKIILTEFYQWFFWSRQYLVSIFQGTFGAFWMLFCILEDLSHSKI